MAYWRQGRKPRTKVKNLMRLGVRVQSAVACGITSKGPWRSSKTPGIQQALSNAYLKSQGLYQLRDGWIKLHYSQWNALCGPACRVLWGLEARHLRLPDYVYSAPFSLLASIDAYSALALLFGSMPFSLHHSCSLGIFIETFFIFLPLAWISEKRVRKQLPPRH